VTPSRLTSTTPGDLAELSALCLRSKGHWGYDAAFLAACREDLRVTQRDLDGYLGVTGPIGHRSGVVSVFVEGHTAYLDKLFVDPAHIGMGLGQALIHWALDTCKSAGASRVVIDSDPFAEAFYRRYGAVKIGETPSTVFPDRRLPLMQIAF